MPSPPSPFDYDVDSRPPLALGRPVGISWTSLTLKLDRHFHTYLLSSMLQAQLVPSNIQLLNQLLQSLSAVIVDIIAPATSNFNLPAIESVFFTHHFWHHHLVHGASIATPASLLGTPTIPFLETNCISGVLLVLLQTRSCSPAISQCTSLPEYN